VLRAETGIALRVHDASGLPAVAWIEIAPYRPGERTEDLYPPNLHRYTDENGEFRLPVPAERSILRASLLDAEHMDSSGPRSPNILLDPGALPVGPLLIVIREPVEVRFDTEITDGVRIDVIDELGLVVATATPQTDGLRVELTPGSYRARRFAGGSSESSETPLQVGSEPMRITFP